MNNIIFNVFNENKKEINNNYKFDLNIPFNISIQEGYEKKVDTLLNGIIDNNFNKKIDKLN